MRLLRSIYAETLGLFVDDGNLALQVLGLVALVTVLTKGAGVPALFGAVVLLVGSIAILIVSVLRRARG